MPASSPFVDPPDAHVNAQSPAALRGFSDRWRQAVSRAPSEFWLVVALLLVLQVALFTNAVWYLPGSADDVRLLSSVARTDSPLEYLARDTGLRKSEYRPLLSMSLWVVYNTMGVRSWPNQLINLALHFANICLLAYLLYSSGLRWTLVLLLSALALASIYTSSPALWVADRPTLLVALTVLGVVAHAAHCLRHQVPVSASLLVALSVAAVMSKESGIIVPVLSAICAWTLGGPMRSRVTASAGCLMVIGVYLAVRLAVLGANAATYDESGYIFGIRHYDAMSELSPGLRLWALGENVVKNVVCVVLPIFDNEGGVESPLDLAKTSGLWLSVLVLVACAMPRPWSPLQRIAVSLILLNALVHYPVFRHRVHYVSWFALCLFIGSSPAILSHETRRRLVTICAGVALTVSVALVARQVQDGWLWRYLMVRERHLVPIQTEFPDQVDPVVVRQILERYGPH